MPKEDSLWKGVFEYIYRGSMNKKNVIRFVRKTHLRPDFFSEMLKYISTEATVDEIGRAKHILEIILKNSLCSTSKLIEYLQATTATHIISIEMVLHAYLVLLEMDKCVSRFDMVLCSSLQLIIDNYYSALLKHGEEDTRLVDIAIQFYQKIRKMFSPLSAHNKFAFLYTCLAFILIRTPNDMKERFLQLTDEIVQNPMFYVLDKEFLAEWKIQSQYFGGNSWAALIFHFIHLSKKNGRLVYAPDYFFIQTLPLASSLLESQSGESVKNILLESQLDEDVDKGLQILEFTLFGVENLNKDNLMPVLPVLKNLTRVMVKNQNIEIKKQALKAIDGIINAFDVTAQYLLLMKLQHIVAKCLQLSNHLISKIKKKRAEQPSENWKGKKVADLLELYLNHTKA